MSSNPTRVPGAYLGRAADSELRFERDFLREIVNVSTPYVELERRVRLGRLREIVVGRLGGNIPTGYRENNASSF
jgi:hypothetical protein